MQPNRKEKHTTLGNNGLIYRHLYFTDKNIIQTDANFEFHSGFQLIQN